MCFEYWIELKGHHLLSRLVHLVYLVCYIIQSVYAYSVQCIVHKIIDLVNKWKEIFESFFVHFICCACSNWNKIFGYIVYNGLSLVSCNCVLYTQVH